MKLSDKLRKLNDPATWLSFRRAARRILQPLPAERFLSQIDHERLQYLQQSYGVPGSRDWPKYVEMDRFLKLNIRRVQDLGLERMPPQRILDLGSGAGYFLFVNRVLGHDGLGLDLDDCPLFEEMFALFGLKRVIHRIEKFEPLPVTDEPYDWITAFSVSFSDHAQEKPWGIEEWNYFLEDAARQLKPGGRIYLDLNPGLDGSFYSAPLRDFFLQRGAVIDRRSKLLFPPR